MPRYWTRGKPAWVCAVNRVIRLTTSPRQRLSVMACIVYGVGLAVEVMQLITLRASERYRRMLRNTVAADQMYTFCNSLLQELRTSSNRWHREEQTFQSWIISMDTKIAIQRTFTAKNGHPCRPVVGQGATSFGNRLSEDLPLLSRRVSPTVARLRRGINSGSGCAIVAPPLVGRRSVLRYG